MKIIKSKKVILLKNNHSKVLDFKNDWMIINYHMLIKYIGNGLKWHQKLRLWSFCKINDYKNIVYNFIYK